MKENFVDDQFPPCDASVGKYHLRHVDQWLRITDIIPDSHEEKKLKWTVFSDPQPNDIEQGALGNCWLVAVMALIAEKPALLNHIVLTKNIDKVGAYLIRICHNGIWKVVLVDDHFPATKYNQLVFTKAKRRQMYIPLIEKACAKLFGSYESLRSGTLIEGLQLMTGAPCDYIDLRQDPQKFDNDLIWGKILSAAESG